MTRVEELVLAAAFAREMQDRATVDNSGAEESLETALWEVECFRQAVRDRKRR